MRCLVKLIIGVSIGAMVAPLLHICIVLSMVFVSSADEAQRFHNISKRAVTEAHVLTENQKKKILDKHNELRRIVSPVASNMLKFKWHDGLQKLATEYSRRCLFVHNKNRQVEGLDYIGENLYVSSGHAITDEYGANAVVDWDNEKLDYDYETKTCKPGKVCGHYTQTAWATTEYVGCGMSTCDTINVFGSQWSMATVVVCNYSPGGNSGGHIYKKGAPCSECPSGYWCDDWLCSNSARQIGKGWKTTLASIMLMSFIFHGMYLRA